MIYFPVNDSSVYLNVHFLQPMVCVSVHKISLEINAISTERRTHKSHPD